MDAEETAVAMVAEFGRFFQQDDVAAVVGGTTWDGRGDAETALRPVDRCAIDGQCHENRHAAVDEIDVDVYEAVHGTDGAALSEALDGRDVYVSGGTISNPYARLVNTSIAPADIDEVTVGDMVRERRFPATFSLEPLRDRDLLDMPVGGFVDAMAAYDTPAEAYRVDPDRPNWVVDVDTGTERTPAFEDIFVPSADGERGYTALDGAQREGWISQQYVPVASGDNWVNDYGVLGMVPHPTDDAHDVLVSSGAHWLATRGANSMLSYATDLGETRIDGNRTALSTLYDITENEGVDHYQAVINTMRTPAGDRSASQEVLRNNLVAVGVLD